MAFVFPESRDDLQGVDPRIQQFLSIVDEYGPDYEVAELLNYYAFVEGHALSYIMATTADESAGEARWLP